MADDDTTPDDRARVVTPDHEPPGRRGDRRDVDRVRRRAGHDTASAGWTVLRDGETPTAEVFSVSSVAADEADGHREARRSDHVFTSGANHVVRDRIGVSTPLDYVLPSMDVDATRKPDEDTHALQLVDGATTSGTACR